MLNLISKNKSIRYKHFILLIFSVLFIFLIISFFHLNFNLDEEYSMGLIQHSYKDIININSLDVHPATYYLVLKFFLSISTFWTKSFFIKVIFARIFSFICYILLFLVLYRITKIIDININWKIQFIVYSLIPVIGFYATDIRMYEFYALFNALMYYCLILFNNTKSNRYLILTAIFTLISLYIDYFSGFCSCVFLFEYFIKYLSSKDWKSFFKIFYVGIFVIIISIPLIVLGLKQISLRTSMGLSTSINFKYSVLDSFTQMNNPDLIRVIPCCLFLLIPMADIIYNRIKYRKLCYILIETLLNYIISIFLLILLLLCFNTQVFEPKVVYAQFTIYTFLSVSMMISHILSIRRIRNIFYIFVLLMLLILPIARIYSNYNVYDETWPSFSRRLNKISNDKNSKVYLNFRQIPKNSFTLKNKSDKFLYVTQASVYLNSFNKKLIVNNCSHGLKRSANNLVTGNRILFERNFNNLTFK